MFKSIFARYITAITIIVLVSFCIMISAISSILSSNSASQKMDSVEHIAVLGNDIVGYGYRSEAGETLTEYVESRTDLGYAVARLIHEDASVILVITDMEGAVLLTGNHGEHDVESLVAEQGFWNGMTQALARDGEYDEKLKLSAWQEEEYYVCARYITDLGGDPCGISLALASDKSTTQIVGATIQTVIMVCLWVMLAMLIAVYFITERTVEPIKRMSTAAKKYAKGKFDTRIDVIGNDEVSELSEAFNNMANELGMLEQKRNQFISDVSHELRSPMMSILGFVEGIRDGSVPKEKEAHYLSLTAGEIKRLSRLVADLLDVSRLEMGEKKLNFTKCNICEIARLVLISLEKRIDEKKLMIEFETDEDSLFIRADEDAMHRVVYNLIENAVKFSDEGALLRIAFTHEKNKEIALEIYNEGVGISKEDLPNIFDRFYKSDKSRGQDKKGVGLGLYFVKTIVTAHDGTIRAESEEGSYCRFILHFPSYQEG